MRKIPTLFMRDPDDMSRVLNQVNPAAAWVLDGEGVPTRKFDGTCVLHDDGMGGWWARREVKPGKGTPADYWPVATDPNTGKTVGWEPIGRSPFKKMWDEAHAYAVAKNIDLPPGTYELCGPKINGNPEGFPLHTLVRHGSEVVASVPLTFEGLREFLSECEIEGIVWHGGGFGMAKIKRRDFGFR